MSRRIYWACEALGIAEEQSTAIGNAKFVPGVQSVGITTNFNLEQIFELGQLEIYEDLEEVPDIEITVEKVFDQYLSLFARAMDPPAANQDVRTIVADQNNECDVWFSVNPDTDEQAGDGNPTAVIHCSGMFVSSVNFNFVTDGFLLNLLLWLAITRCGALHRERRLLVYPQQAHSMPVKSKEGSTSVLILLLLLL